MKQAFKDCPPASTEPMYLISESELNGMIGYEYWRSIIRARGPVVQQQAPDCFNDLGSGECEHSSDGDNGELKPICTLSQKCCHQEVLDRKPVFYQTYCNISKRDAALIAQEREKWEREHTKKPGCYNSCPFDDLCANDIEKIQEIERMAAAQAREDVLDELAQMYANVPEQFLEGTYRLHSEWKEKIESLRNEQERE